MSIPYGALSVTVDVGVVLSVAAHAMGETVDDLTGPCRDRPLVAHRWIAMAAAHQLGHSFPAIGRAFNRDHSTVMHGCQQVAAQPELAERARIIAEEAATPRSLF